MRSLGDLPVVRNKRVLLRVDFDVPVENGKVTDETRIRAALPSIGFLLERQAQVILLAHLGRPTGRDQKFSLRPLIGILENLLVQKVSFIDTLESGEVLPVNLFENLRFWPGEEKNDPGFTKSLARLGQFYVNDAFAVCHRAHASTVGLPKLLPSFAGLNLEREIKELSGVLKNPKRPFLAIIGGAKIETKLPVIFNLATVADKVLVGGKLMFEAERRALPENVVVAHDDVSTKDIGPRSVGLFKELISRARMVVWNGPMGMFEDKKYIEGTREIAISVIESNSYSVVGGGDTISALNKLELLGKMKFVSTGGGAMLEFLAGKKLPGLAALEG